MSRFEGLIILKKYCHFKVKLGNFSSVPIETIVVAQEEAIVVLYWYVLFSKIYIFFKVVAYFNQNSGMKLYYQPWLNLQKL